MVIQTEFDGLLEEDIILEETDNAVDYASILKNSENIMKSFLYLQKVMGGASPFVNAVLKVSTVNTSAESTTYTQNAEAGLIVFKNIDSTNNASIFFNDGEYVLFPYESIELPITEATTLKTNGKFSIIESEYKLGKI